MAGLLLRFMKAFGHDRRGNIAVIFGVALVPMLIAIGAAVDYVRAQRAQSLVQAALDAAVLATATSKADDDDGKIAQGASVFHANFDGKINGATATPNIVIGDGVVTATASLDIDTAVMGLIGVDEVGVGGIAEVRVPGLGEAEIVFVLDYSSSMSGSKFTSMRDASVDLVRLMTDDLANTDVKIGLVPFAAEIYATLPGEYVVGGTTGTPWTNCTSGRKYPHVWKDDTPIPANDDTKWGQTDGGDDDDDDGGGGGFGHCSNYPSRNMQIRPLTDDHQGTIDQLENSSPYSGTNIAVGVEFGYHVVSPNTPFDQASGYDSGIQKVVILLSDGDHNKPGWGPGGSFSVSDASDNIDRLCAEMKSDGILMVTVAYELDHDETEAQLEACASEAQFYIEGTEENIADLFSDLGTSLAKNLYLSR